MFGIDLATAGFPVAAAIAALAGVLSFLSPCVLPIVPPYLAYMTGVNVTGLQARQRSAALPALMFVLGLSTVFVMMGMAASALGQAFLQNQVWFARIAGVVVVILGLHFMQIIRIPILDREARMDVAGNGGAFGAYLLGLAFAFGWTPCIGPQLGMILTLAAQTSEAQRGMALLGVYAAGLGLPFLLSAIFINRSMRLMNRIKPHMQLIERVMGVLLVIVGIALLTGGMSAFSYWLLETFPGLAVLG